MSRDHAHLCAAVTGDGVELQAVGRNEIWVNDTSRKSGAHRLTSGDVLKLKTSGTQLSGAPLYLRLVYRDAAGMAAIDNTGGAAGAAATAAGGAGGVSGAAAAAAPPPPLPLARFGDYFSKGAALGSGGYAEVHRCTERSTGRPFAVKVVDKKRVSHDISARSALGSGSLLEEARILQTLSHPNIVGIERVFDDHVRPDRGSLYIVQVRSYDVHWLVLDAPRSVCIVCLLRDLAWACTPASRYQ